METYLIVRDHCPLCGQEEFNVLLEEPYSTAALKHFLTEFYTGQGMIEYEYLDGNDFTLLQCSHCGFIFQKMIPNAFLAQRIYEHWISPDAAFQIEQEKQTIKEFWNFASDFTKVLAYFDKPPVEIDVFDFGMGWGTTLSIFKSMGCNVYGNEIAQSRIEYAVKNGIVNLTNQELQQKTFDYIHAYQVFEHVDDPVEILKFLVERLNDNGVIRIAVPNGQGMETFIPNITWSKTGNDRVRLSGVDPLEHINCFTYATLLELGERCGLVPVKVKLPLRYQSIYQMLRSWIRIPYRFIKYRETGRIPDIVFKKK